MYDDVAILKKPGTPTYDDYGNPTVTVTTSEIFVQPKGVYQAEYYNAAQNGLKPSLSLFIPNREDYSGEKVLTFQGRDYSVIRVDWAAQRDGITLVCEERANNEE